MVVGLLLTAACGKKNGNASVPGGTVTPAMSGTPTKEITAAPTAEPTAVPTKAPTNTPVPEEIWYPEMIQSSLKSVGNNARLKKVIEKAKAGENVYIATLGGSVTEGAGATTMKQGYAYLFAEEFRKKYGKDGGDNIRFVNAGLGGTPSSLGILRYEKDVVEELGHTPDLLILEFSVNDYQEETAGRAMEALVYNALRGENDPAVVMLFAVFKNKWNLQDNYVAMSKYYGLPMVSIKDAIVKPYAMKVLNDAKFFYDEYHPKNYGHVVMSDCLMYLMDTVDAAEADEMQELPEEPKKSFAFCNTVLIEENMSGVTVEKGSFTEVDRAVQSRGWDNKSSFPNNWKHDPKSGTKALRFTVKCKNFMINYKTSSSAEFGSAEVYVDGKKVRSLEGKTAGGWNNSNLVVVLDESETAEHVIEIKMAEGSEDKAFTVLAAGYSY